MNGGAGEAVLGMARSLWRAAPQPMRDMLGLRIGAALRDGLAAGVTAGPWSAEGRSPLVVSAFYGRSTGVAAAGRATADALEQAGFAVIRHDLGALLDAGGFQAHDLPGDARGVWLIHANAPEAKLALARLRRTEWESRYRIGYWAWELPKVPADWLTASAAFHALWAPSAFVQGALAGAAAPVVMRPHPPPDVTGATPDRAGFALPQGAVIFLAMADLASGFRRKNPLGAVEAYRTAFPRPSPERLLVLKLHGAAARPEALAALDAAIGGRSDIRLIDEAMPHARVLSLIASADVLVSLHRSEGFGLPIAEALALGRAVLATGWSGSETVLHGIDAARAPFRLAAASDPGGPYDLPGQQWAEPDLAAAARRLTGLAREPDLRLSIARDGQVALARLREAWTAEALDREPWSTGVTRLDPYSDR